MKKTIFSIALTASSLLAFNQQTIIVNGGIFGNQSENAHLIVHDESTNSTITIDTIHTQSVQDILFDHTDAYVFAQDSIIRYNMVQKVRMAAARFQGASTKTALLGPNNELIVGNWHSKSSDNIYIYDKLTLALIDSISFVSKGAKSMVLNSNELYVTQNSSSGAPNYSDTLGHILRIDVTNRSLIDSISIASYTGDVGELIAKPDGSGFYSINSVSNTITSFDFPTSGTTNYNIIQNSIGQQLKVSNRSQYSINGDTAFLRMNGGIGAINLSNLSVIDSLIVDTVVTAFAYDTANALFFVTQTDYFSYKKGKVYNRNGGLVDTIAVGSSPEVVRMFYFNSTGLFDNNAEVSQLSVYPNPASNIVYFSIDQRKPTSMQVQLFDLKGSLLKELYTISNKIDVSDLNSGVYLLRIIDKDAVYSHQLIVE